MRNALPLALLAMMVGVLSFLRSSPVRLSSWVPLSGGVWVEFQGKAIPFSHPPTLKEVLGRERRSCSKCLLSRKVESGVSIELREGQVFMRKLPLSKLYLLGLKADVNSIGFKELLSLPGIGPRRAERILSLRHQRGGFSSLKELLMIKGIGRETVKELSSYLEIRDSGRGSLWPQSG